MRTCAGVSGRGETCWKGGKYLVDGKYYCYWHTPIKGERELTKVAALTATEGLTLDELRQLTPEKIKAWLAQE